MGYQRDFAHPKLRVAPLFLTNHKQICLLVVGSGVLVVVVAVTQRHTKRILLLNGMTYSAMLCQV